MVSSVMRVVMAGSVVDVVVDVVMSRRNMLKHSPYANQENFMHGVLSRYLREHHDEVRGELERDGYHREFRHGHDARLKSRKI